MYSELTLPISQLYSKSLSHQITENEQMIKVHQMQVTFCPTGLFFLASPAHLCERIWANKNPHLTRALALSPLMRSLLLCAARQANCIHIRVKSCSPWAPVSLHGLVSADTQGFQPAGGDVGRTEEHQCDSSSLCGGCQRGTRPPDPALAPRRRLVSDWNKLGPH